MRPLVLALMLGLPAGAASAITVSEAALGDFGNNETTGAPGTPAQLGTLDLGVNTISGNLNVVCDGPIAPANCSLLDVLDGFEFTVAAGTALTAATIEITSAGGTPDNFLFGINGAPTTVTPGADLFGSLLSSPMVTEESFLTRIGGNQPAGPQPAGTYRVVASYPVFGADTIVTPPGDGDPIRLAALTQVSSSTFGTAWTVRLTTEQVAPVPLPATLPLALGALGVLGWMRRRKS